MKKLLLVCALLLCLTAFAFAAETTYTGTVSPININTAGEHTVILNGVTIEAVDTPAINVEAPATKLTIILKNGTINTLTGGTFEYNPYENSSYDYGEFYTFGEAAIANKGVTLIIRCENAGEGHECNASCGKLIATGGAYSAGIGGSSAQSFDDADVIYRRGNEDFKGSLTIKGGNIIATSGYQAAAIGGGNGGNFSGTLTITGGNIQANADMSGAGIGGGCSGSIGELASIVISGGNITATSVNAAGIGAGLVEESTGIRGTILISGGTVTANGGRYSAGIGTGSMGGMAGSITITGGTVNATGGIAGAGIGSGATADARMTGSITITGGTVNAVGGKGASGIGGGSNARLSGSITISGGTVNAIGGEQGSGIGASNAASKLDGSITITGGIVTAIGKDGSDAIGAGLGCATTDKASIVIAPAAGMLEAKAGSDNITAAHITGSPYAASTDVTALLKGFAYARIAPYTPPAPEVPKTGDSMNFMLLAAMAMVGMTGMAIVLRRKNEA